MISTRGVAFQQAVLAELPDEPGVYELSQYNITVFVGSADTSIRSKLLAHIGGDEGFCSAASTWVRYEAMPAAQAEARANELLEAYRAEHGALPRCNDLSAWEPAGPDGRRGGGD